MLTSNERKDYILRMIAELRRLVEALLGKVRERESTEEMLARAREAIGKLLGPVGGVATRMDSVTAAQMVNDADVLAVWAEVTAAEGETQRARGDEAAANATARRALELAVEAHLRSPHDLPELLALVERLRPQVNAAALFPRHAAALAEIPPASA